MNDELLAILRSLPSYPTTLREVGDGARRWLFPNATGTGHLDPKNWYHRVWLPALDEAGICNLHFHDLRHTTATRLLASPEVKLSEIAAALGHADTRMTEKHYSHLAPSFVVEAIRKGAPTFGIKDNGKVVSLRRPRRLVLNAVAK